MGLTLSCKLSLELAKLRDSARFVVAEYKSRIIAGGLFVRDGSSVVYYLQGVSDRDYSHMFPSCPVIAEGIRWACGPAPHASILGCPGEKPHLKNSSLFGAHSRNLTGLLSGPTRFGNACLT